MKPVKFGNEKAFEITNHKTITDLKSAIKKYDIEIEYKRYHFLDKNRALELKQNKHSFVLNTFGTKYLLFLTHLNTKKYAIYINRKNETIYLVKTRFSEDLYNDTILEGESVKINEKWYFLIGDCLIYKGEINISKNFDCRLNHIDKILKDEYISDDYMEPFMLMKKDVFNYSDIQNVRDKYIPTLPFTVNGYLFKSYSISSYDILYIFPECRNVKEPVKEPVKESIKEETDGQANGQVNGQAEGHINENSSIFLMKKTEYPDVYEINTGKKTEYAGIPNIHISQVVRLWFSDKNQLRVLFKQNTINEKWEPISISE